MLVLLAESKTMSAHQLRITGDDFKEHIPCLEPYADKIMEYLAGLSPALISEILDISLSLAIKVHNMAYDFPNKSMGKEAIFSFIGDAFKGLDINSLPTQTITASDKVLRLISSVYGILKPSDIIKPYRCEFNKRISPTNKTAIEVFKPKVTVELVNFIKENKINDIIDLLPADADKCVDWKIVRAFSSVHKICFKTINSEGKLKTPIAKNLKITRGKMCRFILENQISSFKELSTKESADFFFSPEDSKTGMPVFIIAE